MSQFLTLIKYEIIPHVDDDTLLALYNTSSDLRTFIKEYDEWRIASIRLRKISSGKVCHDYIFSHFDEVMEFIHILDDVSSSETEFPKYGNLYYGLNNIEEHKMIPLSYAIENFKYEIQKINNYRLYCDERHMDCETCGLPAEIRRSCKEPKGWRGSEAHKKLLEACGKEKDDFEEIDESVEYVEPEEYEKDRGTIEECYECKERRYKLKMIYANDLELQPFCHVKALGSLINLLN
jgi:hypothetical protein